MRRRERNSWEGERRERNREEKLEGRKGRGADHGLEGEGEESSWEGGRRGADHGWREEGRRAVGREGRERERVKGTRD